jgi:hypothetical protein
MPYDKVNGFVEDPRIAPRRLQSLATTYSSIA